MPRIMAILNSDSAGYQVRMDDNKYAIIPHGAHAPCIGEEFDLDEEGHPVYKPGGLPHLQGAAPAHPPNVPMPVEYGAGGLNLERANSPDQVKANILSEFVSPAENVRRADFKEPPMEWPRTPQHSVDVDNDPAEALPTPMGALTNTEEPRDATDAEIAADEREQERKDQAREDRAEDKAASEA